MALLVRKNHDESWRDAVARIAGVHGLAGECLDLFDADIVRGAEESRAAFDALYEWDCVEYES